MAVAIAVGEPPPGWVVHELRHADVELRHVVDPGRSLDGDLVIGYVMNSYGPEPTAMTDDLAGRFPALRLVIYQGQSREPDDYRSLVDLESMRRRGVMVAHSPGGAAVAEAAFGVLIALDLDLLSASGSQVPLPPHRGLSGSTLGILGLGQIGADVARLGVVAGMKVQYASRHDHPDAESNLGLRRVGIEELFSSSQFLSVHVATSTRPGLIDGRLLSLSRELILVNNTSIPKIIEPGALLNALHSGSVRRAYSEGLYPEPWQRRLVDLGPARFVSVPAYTSWDTTQARSAGWESTVSALRALVAGEVVPHRLI